MMWSVQEFCRQKDITYQHPDNDKAFCARYKDNSWMQTTVTGRQRSVIQIWDTLQPLDVSESSPDDDGEELLQVSCFQ